MRLYRPAWIMALGFTLLLAALISAYQLALAQEPDPAQLTLGARLYNENCAVCHGVNGQGRIGATLAKDWPSVQPELTVRSTISNGVKGSVMPAWSQANGGPLSDAEINALVAYILSWQTGGVLQLTPPPTPTPFPPMTPVPGVEGDPNIGAVLFAGNCAPCHGDKGQGRIGATLAKNWPGVRPDLAVKETITEGVAGSVMPAWSQVKGGPLSDSDINNLVAFIMTLPAQPDQSQPTPVPTTTPSTFFTGWGGVLVFVILLIVIIAIALVAQRRES